MESLPQFAHQHAHQCFRVADFPASIWRMVPQAAIRRRYFPGESTHNSIWDLSGSGDGRLYASLCNELIGSAPAQFYEYQPDQDRLTLRFDVGVETLVGSRCIPPSKIHTSIQELGDGRLIMATHTTSPAPGHRHWLLPNYYEHQWEGFPGSHLLMYDPQRQDVRSLGMPVSRDSIYGAKYDAISDRLWFTTFLKGHLWSYRISTRAVRDHGQITEFGSWSLAKDALGGIYTSSRSGHLFHIDPLTDRIDDLGVIAHQAETNARWHGQRVLAFHANGPDGRLYLTFHFSDALFAIDPRTRRIERVGDLVPADLRASSAIASRQITGMAFDSRGVLWYGLINHLDPFLGSTVLLVRWPVLSGGQAESCGLLGTPDRVVASVSEVVMDRQRDVLHLADTNYCDGPPSIVSVDLRAVERDLALPPVTATDPHAYLLFCDAPRVFPALELGERSQPLHRQAVEVRALAEDAARHGGGEVRAARVRAVRLWEILGRGRCPVRALRWEGDEALRVWCGVGQDEQQVEIVGGVFTRVVPADQARQLWPCPLPVAGSVLPDGARDAVLPARQGRRGLATASCWTPWVGDGILVGTRDGLLAKVDRRSGQVFALGAIGSHGPVHQLVSDPVAGIAYGVSGDPADLGHVFTYDDRQGLRELGRTYSEDTGLCGVVSNSEPCAVALSADGQRLAVGVRDDLATIYLYDQPRAS